MLWIARTGSPWRDLPALFGRWNTVFKRYRDWVKADVLKRLFDAFSDQPDRECAMIDATIVKSLPRRKPGCTATARAQKGDCAPGHRPLQGRHDDQDPGPHRALGNLVRFVLLFGQRFATAGVAPLIEGIEFCALIAIRALTATTSSPLSTSAAPSSSPRSIRAAPCRGRSTPRWTNGVI